MGASERPDKEGWYPDPNDQSGRWLRWWTGTGWGEDTRIAPRKEYRPIESLSTPVWITSIGGVAGRSVAAGGKTIQGRLELAKGRIHFIAETADSAEVAEWLESQAGRPGIAAKLASGAEAEALDFERASASAKVGDEGMVLNVNGGTWTFLFYNPANAVGVAGISSRQDARPHSMGWKRVFPYTYRRNWPRWLRWRL